MAVRQVHSSSVENRLEEVLDVAEVYDNDGSRSPGGEDVLTLNEKGTVKLFGNFEQLQYLIENLELAPAKWSTVGGKCKCYENSDITKRWYFGTGTLSVRGEKGRSDKVKAAMSNRKQPKKVTFKSKHRYEDGK